MIERFTHMSRGLESQKVISILICSFLFSITCQGFSTKASAAMNKTFTPRISIQMEYDDNIYLSQNNKYSNWITTISPGLSLALDYPKTELSLNYQTGLIFYQDNSARDTISHRGNGRWKKQLSRHVSLNASDNFIYSEDPILERFESEGQIAEILSDRRTYYINEGRVSLSSQVGAGSSLSLGYGNRYFDNKPVRFQDSLSHDYFFNLNTRFNPVFGIGLTSSINRGEFKRPEGPRKGSKDFYDYEGTITLNYRWSPHHHLYVKYSLLKKDFDEPGEGPDKIGFWLHQSALGSNFVLSPYTNFNIEGGYFFQDFINGREESGATYNTLFSTRKDRASFSLEGSGGYYQDYFSSENLGSSRLNQVFGSANYQCTKNLRTSISTNYKWQEFFGDDDVRDRKDEVWRVSAGFYFSFWRRLGLSLTGTHSERESSNPNLDFKDNRVIISLTGAYPVRF